MLRLRAATFAVVAVAAALAAQAAAVTASAAVLEHAPTGFRAVAPADFSVTFDRARGRYVISSSVRRAALSYRRVRAGGRRSRRLVKIERGRESRRLRALLRRIGDSARGGRAVGAPQRRGRKPRRSRARTRPGRGRGSRPRPTQPVPAPEPTPTDPEPTPIDPEPTPIDPEPTPTDPEPTPTDPEPTPTDPEPTPTDPEPTPTDPNPVPSEPAGEVLFHSGFESGSFAGLYVQSLAERASIVAGGAFGSAHAARFEVRDGDREPDTGSERSEMSLSTPKFHDGQEIYIRDTFRVPSTSSYGSSWQIINQIHETDWSGSPGLAVFLERGPAITISAGDGSPTFLDSHPIQLDRWHDLVYRVKFSRDPNIGYIEAWLDGTPLRLQNGQHRMYQQTLQAPSGYLKAGIYRSRNHTGTSTIYHDNLTAATTLAAVRGD